MSRLPSSPWHDETRIEFVSKLWFAGESAAQICMAVNRQYNFTLTRNSIIGIVHRMGWSGRVKVNANRVVAKPVPPSKGQRPVIRPLPRVAPKPPRPIAIMEPPVNCSAPIEHHLPLLDLHRGDCRWPTSERDGLHLFCAAPALFEKPYCAFHLAKSVTPRPVTMRFVREASRG